MTKRTGVPAEREEVKYGVCKRVPPGALMGKAGEQAGALLPPRQLRPRTSHGRRAVGANCKDDVQDKHVEEVEVHEAKYHSIEKHRHWQRHADFHHAEHGNQRRTCLEPYPSKHHGH